MKEKFAKGIRIPGWLFLLGMSLYAELLLHFWTNPEIVVGRLVQVVLFSAAFGLGLGLISSAFSGKTERWVAVGLGFLLGALMLLQYYIHDAYQVFMPMVSVFATAEGVATGYFNEIVGLLSKAGWRILVVMLPVVLYAVFSRGGSRGWKRSAALALATLVFYGGSLGVVRAVGLDQDKFDASANFDGTVRSFGLSMGLVLDLTGGKVSGSSDEFVIPETTEAPTTAPQETEAPQQTEPEETTVPTEPPKVYLPHSYDLDFAALAAEETNKNIAALHSYLATQTPAMENDYTGLFAGKNLVIITAEAFSAQVIDPELTPTLYRMANEGIKFNEYYHPVWGCGTTGGEFANLLSLVPYGGTTTMMEAVEQNLFFTMGHQLQKQGYSSAAFHNNDHTYYNRHKTHTELGYDTFFAWGNGMEELISNGWTRSDKEMVDVTLPDYLDKTPFSLYYMSVSGHASYDLGNDMAEKNYHLVEHLPYSRAVKCYLACSMELEFAMESMINMLEEAGIADDTVIVISTDHYPYGLAPTATWSGGLGELYGGQNWGDEKVRDRNALIIWSGCLEDMDIVVDEPVYALDILPTLSNLFGVEYDSRLMVGRDVFSEQEPLVFFPTTGGWLTDKGSYDAKSGKFTPREGVEVSEDYVKNTTAIVRNKMKYSRDVQYYDYFNVISDLMGFSRED